MVPEAVPLQVAVFQPVPAAFGTLLVEFLLLEHAMGLLVLRLEDPIVFVAEVASSQIHWIGFEVPLSLL